MTSLRRLVLVAIVIASNPGVAETKQPLLVASMTDFFGGGFSTLLVLYTDGELVHRDRDNDGVERWRHVVLTAAEQRALLLLAGADQIRGVGQVRNPGIDDGESHCLHTFVAGTHHRACAYPINHNPPGGVAARWDKVIAFRSPRERPWQPMELEVSVAQKPDACHPAPVPWDARWPRPRWGAARYVFADAVLVPASSLPLWRAAEAKEGYCRHAVQLDGITRRAGVKFHLPAIEQWHVR